MKRLTIKQACPLFLYKAKMFLPFGPLFALMHRPESPVSIRAGRKLIRAVSRPPLNRILTRRNGHPRPNFRLINYLHTGSRPKSPRPAPRRL